MTKDGTDAIHPLLLCLLIICGFGPYIAALVWVIL